MPLCRRPALSLSRAGLLRRARRAESAFSMVELVVVLVILGMVAAVSLPLLIGSGKTFRMKKALREITSMVRYARSEAIARGTTVTMSLDLSTNTVSISAAVPSIKLSLPPEKDTSPIKTLEDLNREEAAARPQTAAKPIKKKLSADVKLAYESFFREDVLTGGSIDIQFFSRGNCQGGIFYVYNEVGDGYQIFLEPMTGVPEIGKEMVSILFPT